MKSHLLIFVLFLSLASCSSEKTPPKKIQKEDIPFIDQIADMYFIDIWISRIGASDKDSIRIELCKQFAELHGKEVEELKSSLKVLESEPKRYGLIMDSVISILKNKQPVKEVESK